MATMTTNYYEPFSRPFYARRKIRPPEDEWPPHPTGEVPTKKQEEDIVREIARLIVLAGQWSLEAKKDAYNDSRIARAVGDTVASRRGILYGGRWAFDMAGYQILLAAGELKCRRSKAPRDADKQFSAELASLILKIWSVGLAAKKDAARDSDIVRRVGKKLSDANHTTFASHWVADVAAYNILLAASEVQGNRTCEYADCEGEPVMLIEGKRICRIHAREIAAQIGAPVEAA